MSTHEDNNSARTEFPKLLKALGAKKSETMSISSDISGTFTSKVMSASAAAGEVVPAMKGNAWYSINVLSDEAKGKKGRGVADDVVGVRALYSDLDFKASGLGSVETARAVVKDVSKALGVTVCAVVTTGGGVHPYWRLLGDDGGRLRWEASDTATRARVQAAYRRFGRLVSAIAERHGGRVDAVYDLARVLRIPGTYNTNYSPPSVVGVNVGERGCADGYGITLGALESVLEAAGVDETDSDREQVGETVAAPESWTWASKPCEYVNIMISGWDLDIPRRGRHPWMLGQSTRLAAAARLGYLTESQWTHGLERLAARFDELLSTGEGAPDGQGRSAAPGELSGGIAWGISRAARMSQRRAASELAGVEPDGSRGGHVHDGDPFGSGARCPSAADDGELALSPAAAGDDGGGDEGGGTSGSDDADGSSGNDGDSGDNDFDDDDGRGERAERVLKKADPNRPAVDATSSVVSTEWLQENIGAGRLSGLFARASEVVHTPCEDENGYVELTGDDRDSDGPAQVRVADADYIKASVQFLYRPYKLVQEKGATSWTKKKTMFQTEAAKVATSRPDLCPNLRRLRGVTHTPVVRSDGTILDRPGYDPATKMLYLPDDDLRVSVPAEVGVADVKASVALLDEMTSDFPWTSGADRANYFGLLLTPLMRLLTPPPYKLGAFSAPQPGSGKTLLAKVLHRLHGGVFRSEVPRDEAEIKKQITSILTVTTAPVVTFDNVSGVLKSSVLDGLLTSETWTDRVLGATAETERPNDRLWTITGNNVHIGGDMARRTLWCSIDPGMPDPQNRTGFAIENLARWAKKRRGELLTALLVLIRAWGQEGRPLAPADSSDDYATWIRTVGGILESAGVEGFNSATSRREVASTEDDEWEMFLEAAYTRYGESEWTARQLLTDAADEALKARYPSNDDTDKDPFTANGHAAAVTMIDVLPGDLSERASRGSATSVSKSLGRWLANHEGRWAGRLVVRNVSSQRNGVKYWRISVHDGN